MILGGQADLLQRHVLQRRQVGYLGPLQIESPQVLVILEVGQPHIAHLRVAQDENGSGPCSS